MSSSQKCMDSQRRQSMPVTPTCSTGRRKSLLQNIFKTRHRNSLPDIDKGKPLELISLNHLEDGQVYSSLTCERARVWRVRHRNSISETVDKNLDLEPLREKQLTAKKKDYEKVIVKRIESQLLYTGQYKFDIISLFQDFIMYHSVQISSNLDGRNLILKQLSNSCECTDCRNQCMKIGENEGRSDSNPYPNVTTVCQGSPITSSRLSLDMEASTVSLRNGPRADTEHLNTSYWDLCIPDKDDENIGVPRRNSWSQGVATFPKSGVLTNSYGTHSLSRYNGMDNFKRQCSRQTCLERASIASSSPIPHGKTHRRVKHSVSRKRSNSESCEKVPKDKQKIFHRSRSVDCGHRPRNLRRSRRISSLVRHIPFSDIEASDASDVEPLQSGESSRRDSRISSSSVELCSSSSEGKDSGYQKTDESDKIDTGEERNNTRHASKYDEDKTVIDKEIGAPADNTRFPNELSPDSMHNSANDVALPEEENILANNLGSSLIETSNDGKSVRANIPIDSCSQLKLPEKHGKPLDEKDLNLNEKPDDCNNLSTAVTQNKHSELTLSIEANDQVVEKEQDLISFDEIENLDESKHETLNNLCIDGKCLNTPDDQTSIDTNSDACYEALSTVCIHTSHEGTSVDHRQIEKPDDESTCADKELVDLKKVQACVDNLDGTSVDLGVFNKCHDEPKADTNTESFDRKVGNLSMNLCDTPVECEKANTSKIGSIEDNKVEFIQNNGKIDDIEIPIVPDCLEHITTLGDDLKDMETKKTERKQGLQSFNTDDQINDHCDDDIGKDENDKTLDAIESDCKHEDPEKDTSGKTLDATDSNDKLDEPYVDYENTKPLEDASDYKQETRRGRTQRALSLDPYDQSITQYRNSLSTGVNQDNKLEFKSMSVEDLLFCSGRSSSSNGETDDVKDVFDAITKETEKLENKDKDMMVVFLVGGELKVLRRSGATGHGDRIRTDLPSMTRQDFPQFNGNHDQVVYSSHPPAEYKRPRPKSEIIVGRSQSFAGMAEPSPQRKAIPGAMVLGESFRHHRGATMPTQKASPVVKGAVGVSFRKSPKIPKVPRPNRALLMFQSVKKGIREFIEATKEDIEDLQTRDMDVTSTAQQLKSAERYLKRLEFHLSKLDELHEYYMVQQQLREGVRTMHKAYVTSPGKQRNTLSNVKYGYKECTQTMCNIEAQLEAMMGTFNCKLKGIAGFARLCPGDVFEVTTRHGTQKWKTKGRIEKTGHQKWDIPEFNFKAIVGDIINIKGVEVRAFKSILLGQKSCETKDLFSSNPQLMTVSINVNGSLKLSIVITWNPLDGVDESVAYIEAPMRPQGTPRRRPVSVIAINGHQLPNAESQYEYERRHSNPPSMIQSPSRDDNFILRSNASTPHINNISSYHGLDSPHVGSRVNDHLPEAYHHTQLGPLYSQSIGGNFPAGYGGSSPALYRETDSNPQPVNQSSVFSSPLPPVTSHLHFPSVSFNRLNGSMGVDSAVSNIEDVVHNLTSALEDYHGQYSELNKLEELVKLAHKLMRRQLRHNSRSSSISVSIEDALEAFDFLDTEEITEDPQSPAMNNTKTSYEDMLCSPESTAKTGDSGIESLAERLSEDTQLESSHGSSPVPPSLGNEEVDQCLMYHLTYCERLLENLGAFGPLKCREIYALDKLQKQTTIIEGLLKLAKSGSQVDLHNVMTSLCDNKPLREFWVKCTDQNSLFVSPDRLLLCLEQKYATVISEKYGMDPAKVCQHVITRILDIPDYESEQGRPFFVITLHQFMLYFNDEGGLNHVESVAEELKLVERLMSGNSDMVIKAILTLRDSIPTAPCLKVIGMLLVTLDKEVEQCTISYLSLIQKKKENRDSAMIVFVEGLEDQTSEIRAGACTALAILEATESIDQLVYLWQSDSSLLVQNKAKEALQSMGEEGKRAFDEAQLSKHGFQGIQVKKGTFM